MKLAINSSENELYKTMVFEPDRTTDLDNILNNVTAPSDVCEEISHIKNDISSLKNELSTFKTELKQQIKEDYCKINLSLDIFKVLSSKDQPRKEITVPNPKQDLLQNVKFPLESCEQISLLDKQIRNDTEFRAQLIEFLSKIGGHTGVEHGSKIAYKIVDCVFKSEVLMQYSWTGVSRAASGEKKSFQMLEGILGVSFEVIFLSDNRHTQKKNCSIFKDGVLRHAKKRSARKRIRPAVEPTVDNNNTDAAINNNVLTENEDDNVTENEERETENDTGVDI